MGASAAPLAIIRPTFGTSPQDAEARMSLQQMAGQQVIQKQIQAENALKLQAQQEDQQDQQTIQQALKDNIGPDGIDFDKVQATIAPKVRYRNLTALQDLHGKILDAAVKMDRTKREQLLARNTSIGNELMGLLDLPQDQRAPAYAVARQRLIQTGDIKPDDPQYPENVPLDDDTLKSHLVQVQFGKQIAERAKSLADEEEKKQLAARAKAQADKADADAKAKTIQQGIEDAARDHLAVSNQQEHDDWWGALPSDVQKRMPKKFDPDKTPEIIQNMALTAEQRQQNLQKNAKAQDDARKALVAGGETGLAYLAHDPTVGKGTNDAAAAALKDVVAAKAKTTGGMTENERQVQQDKELTRLSTERNRYQSVRDSEVKLWDKAQKFDFAIQAAQKAGAKTIKDPTTGREISLEAAIAEQASTKAAAQEKNADGKLILQQNKWGEFAPGAQQTQPTPTPQAQPGVNPPAVTPPAAAPVATPPAVTPAATPAPSAVKTASKMKLRTDVPAKISDALKDGESRLVNTPQGQITLKKSGGKIYQVE